MFAKRFFIIFIFIFSLNLSTNEYSPAVGKNYPDKLLWSDTHLHTNGQLMHGQSEIQFNAK